MGHYITSQLASCKPYQRILISLFAVCLISASVAPIHAQAGDDNHLNGVEQTTTTETTQNAVVPLAGASMGIGLATIQMFSIGFMFVWLFAFIIYNHRRESNPQIEYAVNDPESPIWTETSHVGRIYKTGSRS